MPQAAAIKIAKLRIPAFVMFSSHLVVTSRSLRSGRAIVPTFLSAAECYQSKPVPDAEVDLVRWTGRELISERSRAYFFLCFWPYQYYCERQLVRLSSNLDDWKHWKIRWPTNGFMPQP